jgi:AcrR family transcriptional regulator
MVVGLSRHDWVEAALRALTFEGLAGVAVEPLARALGTTKGSFYWHFSDRAALVAATLELWEQRDTTEIIERIRALPTPRGRLEALGAGAYASAATGNAHATVLAVADDPLVAPVLQRVTKTRLAFLAAQYRGLGCRRREAVQLARLAYALYLGIAEVRRADPAGEPTGAALRTYLDLAVNVMVAPIERHGPDMTQTDRQSRPVSAPGLAGAGLQAAEDSLRDQAATMTTDATSPP